MRAEMYHEFHDFCVAEIGVKLPLQDFTENN